MPKPPPSIAIERPLAAETRREHRFRPVFVGVGGAGASVIDLRMPRTGEDDALALAAPLRGMYYLG